jgi:hypothetical protein
MSQQDTTQRALLLLSVAADALGQLEFDELCCLTVFYDGAHCDGQCILDDIKAVLEEIDAP